jgi:hypothetical protein
MIIVIKTETMVLWCETCKTFTDQGLIHASGEYRCLLCGTITVLEGENASG